MESGTTWGACVLSDGRTRFRIWAPAQEQVRLALEGVDEALPLRREGGGWHELTTRRARVGSRYRFEMSDGLKVPDPASRFQPEDVSGPSEVTDPAAFKWTDSAWQGRAWHEAVIYELHVGAFSPEGTFAGVQERLDHLVQLGITAIEIMPIADFPGRFNWGYDGVLPYAPDSSYGRPEQLKALIDAAHARGLMVLLDVVYNHFGPDGNYLGTYAPQFFTSRHQTPWGAGINFDGAESAPVRTFFIENALYWLQEFHFDGLRLDAVHSILDDSPRHILDELAERVRAEITDRTVHLVLENEENEATLLKRDESGRACCYTAQWNDDLHHVLHAAATGEGHGYYHEYLGDDRKLGRALAEGFAFQGEEMKYRALARGEPSAGLPPDAFIAFLQNHDQIGNRAFGERISEIAPAEALRAVTAIYLLLPQIPMLFMGEEWGASQPFVFFCDFAGELAEAIRKGRLQEFARFPQFQDRDTRTRIPDPTSADSFSSAKLDWNVSGLTTHRSWLEWYRNMLDVRHREIVPRIPRIGGHAGRYDTLGPLAVRARWRVGGDEELILTTNLCHTPAEIHEPVTGRVIWSEGDAQTDTLLPAWSVCWRIGSVR
jgi:malto-oligosyltrehalose trehalohydrolase